MEITDRGKKLHLERTDRGEKPHLERDNRQGREKGQENLWRETPWERGLNSPLGTKGKERAETPWRLNSPRGLKEIEWGIETRIGDKLREKKGQPIGEAQPSKWWWGGRRGSAFPHYLQCKRTGALLFNLGRRVKIKKFFFIHSSLPKKIVVYRSSFAYALLYTC